VVKGFDIAKELAEIEREGLSRHKTRGTPQSDVESCHARRKKDSGRTGPEMVRSGDRGNDDE